MVLLCLASLNAVARADGEQVATAADPATAPTPTVSAPAPAPVPAASGGISLRNGLSLSVGQENGSGPSASLSGQLYGVDWRIGAKITDNIAAYLDSHLSFGTAHVGNESGVTGNFATALIGEYTFPMRIFAGGGAGYGVLNNPSGPLVQARVGWYPFEAQGDGKSRRLNVALDARFYFTTSNGMDNGTVSHIALTLGYDRF
jgi:hypothetical protein